MNVQILLVGVNTKRAVISHPVFPCNIDMKLIMAKQGKKLSFLTTFACSQWHYNKHLSAFLAVKSLSGFCFVG